MTVRVCKLPTKLRPTQPNTLRRLGGPDDGGYLVDERDIETSDGLLTLGLDCDWRFEKQFRRWRRVPIHAYDGCTSVRYLLRRVGSAARSTNWRWCFRSLVSIADYLWFFSGGRAKHFMFFVETDRFAYEATGARTVSIDEVFQNMEQAGSRRPFLKVDIEGSEYFVIDALVERAKNTAGLAIEFHDCDTALPEIISFVEAYPLTLVHLHPNSRGGVGPRGIPQVMELTFSSHAAPTGGTTVLPHPLDSVCDRDEKIVIEFE